MSFPVFGHDYAPVYPQPIPIKRKKAQPWTPEEDEKLIQAVKTHGAENWIMIAQYVGGGRTRSQCSQRWLRVINPKLRKLNWSTEEDTLLLQAVEKVGTKSWSKVAAIVGQRCDVQCRYRYQQLMKQQNTKYNSAPVPDPVPAVPVRIPTFAVEAPAEFRPSIPAQQTAPKQKIPSIWSIIGSKFAM